VIDPIIILPRYYADRMIGCRKDYGLVYTRADERDQVFLVDGFTKGQNFGQHKGGSKAAERHYLAHATMSTAAVWYRAEPELHLYGFEGSRRSGALPLDDFRAGLHGSWIGLTRGGLQLCLTCARIDTDTHDWRAWVLSQDLARAQLADIQVIEEDDELRSSPTTPRPRRSSPPSPKSSEDSSTPPPRGWSGTRRTRQPRSCRAGAASPTRFPPARECPWAAST
jgi:hypothetical protein